MRNCEIARLLSIDPATVSRTIKRYQEEGHDGCRTGSGRKRYVRIPRNRELILERIKRNPRVSKRKIARETGISRKSLRRVVKKDLKFKPY